MELTHFDQVQPSVLRSLRQTRLLESWGAAAAKADGLPLLAEFVALGDYPEQGELTIYDVVRHMPAPRYIVAKEGVAFKNALDSNAGGRFVDEVLPPEVWRAARPNFDTCVETGKPVYATFGAIKWQDQRMLCERLLLPFGTKPFGVVTILSSFKMTSWEERPCSPDAYRQYPDYGYRAIIDVV